MFIADNKHGHNMSNLGFFLYCHANNAMFWLNCKSDPHDLCARKSKFCDDQPA